MCWACSALLQNGERAARQACALQVGGQTVAGVKIGASSMANTTNFGIEGLRVSPWRPAGQTMCLTLIMAGLDRCDMWEVCVACRPSWPPYRNITQPFSCQAYNRCPTCCPAALCPQDIFEGHSLGPLISAVDQPAAASGEERLLKPLPDWGSSELRELGGAITRDIYQHSPGKSGLPRYL